MAKTADQLQAILDKGDEKACVRFFAKSTEAERKSLAKLSEAWLRKISKNFLLQTKPGTYSMNPLLPAAGVAALATCSLSTLQSRGLRLHFEDEICVRVLADRKPNWIADYAESILDTAYPNWSLVRSLMRAGLCGRPKHENYLLGMLRLHAGVGSDSAVPPKQNRKSKLKGTISRHLTDEPDLLEEVWRLFETEGRGEFSLAAHDKFSRDAARWDYAFAELSDKKFLSRDRLLTASLDALDRTLPQFQAGWFSAFHESLKPTLKERLARTEQYLRLLASPIPPTATFALKAIELIDKEQPIPASRYIDALQPLMLARHKGTVKAALKRIGELIRREPKKAEQALRVVAEALAHEANEVQASAFGLIEKFGRPDNQELRAALQEMADRVAASLRKRVRTWLQSGAASPADSPVMMPRPAPAADTRSLEKRIAKLPAPLRAAAGVDEALAALKDGRLHTTACVFNGLDIPRLDTARAIRPIETLDELIDAAAATIENADQYDDIERVSDGISRLCDQRPPDFDRRTAPLLQRARTLARSGASPFIGRVPRDDFVGIVLSWIAGDYGLIRITKINGEPAYQYKLDAESSWEDDSTWNTKATHARIEDILMDRARELADRVRKRIAVATLCAPTHAGGWLDPRVLADRVQDKQTLAQATDLEKALALLRLAPDHRATALKRLPESKGEFILALRYALGDTSKSLGPTDWLWAAAARARNPHGDDPALEKKHPKLGPDGGTAAKAAFSASVGQRKTEYGTFKTAELHIEVTPAPLKSSDGRLLTVLLWKPSKDPLEFDSIGLIRQIYSVWPLSLEPTFALGARAIGDNLDWWEAHWPHRAFLEPILDPDVPLGPMALLLLVLGLAAKEPGEHGLATDAAIAAIHDGRLDGQKLGGVMAQLLPTGYVKAARWAKTLTSVAAISPLHAEVVRDAIAGALQGNPESMPKDFHALIDLLQELVAETNTAVGESARQFLSKLAGGKLGRAAKAILATNSEPNSARLASIQQAVIEQRVARAERWSKRMM